MEDLRPEIDRLKREYVETERVYSDEKACLLKVINIFGTVVDKHAEFAEERQAIKEMLNSENALPLDRIQAEIGKLRSRIFTEETKAGPDESDTEKVNEINKRLFKACRNIKRIMLPFFDGFYPVTKELKEKADGINIRCHSEMAEAELDEPTNAFLSFVKGLKGKISEDFGYVNKTFLMLLKHVKELENMLSSEFGGNDRLREIEHFEIKINKEVGSIVNSFDIHARISEIKNAVVTKLSNIKRLVAKRKKDELKRSKRTKGSINKLKNQIVNAEKDAHKMSKKAEHFRKAAKKDGLTGLHNRSSFDERLKDTLELFNNGGETFLVVLFDVDNFKSINDTFGHVAGDKVLKVVARTLIESFRKNDFIARYGGDEFVVIIEGLSEEMAHERTEKFAKNFSEKRFTSTMAGKDININISAGIAVANAGEDPDDLIRRADLAMYDSKKKKHSI
ncbi:MAG: GGDEF domain-containing protein [Deltaproteobacteria bacterium]|nr:GGDEF domain-containing protein [Deltaproteobacteria bacterium]